MRFRSLLLGMCALSIPFALAACSSTTSSSGPAPQLSNPTATAKPLVNEFFMLLEKRDTTGLESFLSPAFQVVRADGTSSEKSAYLSNYPVVDSFHLTNVSATQSGSVLVVRYLATATGVVNGKRYTPGPAPRLSVFEWNGSRWQLVGHANFNPLTG
jgi:hypothetical protein